MKSKIPKQCALSQSVSLSIAAEKSLDTEIPDLTYDHVKTKLFSYLKSNIPEVLKGQDTIQYSEFVNGKKIPFVNEFVTDCEIMIFRKKLQWFDKIVNNYDNHDIIIKYIEDQMEILEMVKKNKKLK